MRQPMKKSWYEPLYISDSVKNRENEIRSQIKKGRVESGWYAITLASNGCDYLDLIASAYLKQRALLRSLPMIVGIAETREEAYSLIETIAGDCFRKTGNADIRAFLEAVQQSRANCP